VAYRQRVPKLWNNTIEEHRRTVQTAILDTTAALVAEQGLASVTMSQIAQNAGIGRATLYKYFADVEAVVTAWHERQIDDHLRQLTDARNHAAGAAQQLEAVLRAFALINHQTRHGQELATLLHQGEHVARAHRHLRDFVTDLITEAAAGQHIRSDVAPPELAAYCLHALTAASGLPTKAAVTRLVAVTLAGLRAHSHLGDG
jgi:AcrR family transcriptional regulator